MALTIFYLTSCSTGSCIADRHISEWTFDLWPREGGGKG
jgi:hypothetical protein